MVAYTLCKYVRSKKKKEKEDNVYISDIIFHSKETN